MAVYKFSNASNEWERKEIEGSMFVVHRQTPQQSYAFVVINRLNTTNMLQTIDRNFDINITIPYLLYKNSQNEIFCIWFYNENDCINFGQSLQKIIDKLSEENNQHNNTQPDILKKLFQMDLNNDERSVLRGHTNGGAVGRASGPSNGPTGQPQKLSLQVHQLFESHTMSAQSVSQLPVIPSEAQNLEDSFLNDVITPAMLTSQTRVITVKPPDADSINILPHPQSPMTAMSTCAQIQTSAPIPVNHVYTHNFNLPVASKDKSLGQANHLTMEQLKQTLVHLLQNDADFLHSIHSAYVNGISKLNWIELNWIELVNEMVTTQWPPN